MNNLRAHKNETIVLTIHTMQSFKHHRAHVLRQKLNRTDTLNFYVIFFPTLCLGLSLGLGISFAWSVYSLNI